MRSTRAARIITVAAALTALLASVQPASAATTSGPVAYQGSATHDGNSADGVAPPLGRRWQRSFGGQVSDPLLADGHAFVTTSVPNAYGTLLYALDADSGATVWGPVDLGGTYSFSGIAYDGGAVFAVNYNGLLRAFDAATGAPLWTTQLTGQYAFTSPPTAANGMVYVGGAGSGGTVYGVSQASGAIVWRAGVANGDHSSPAVTPSAVYVSYACNQAYALDPATGQQLWHHTSYCSGGGGKTVAVHNGQVFTRDFTGNLVLDGATGATVRSYSATTIPAFAGDMMLALNGRTLQGVDATGTVRWSFAADGTLNSAPVVAGGYAYVGSGSGNVYAVETSTGRQVWSGNVGAPVGAPDEQNATLLTGLAVSHELLLVPAGTSLTAFGQAGPTIVATAVGTPGDNGWFTSHVTVHFTCTAGAEALVTSCPSDVALHQQGADQVVTGSVTDAAGRTATASLSVSIDTGAPTVAISNGSVTIGHEVVGTVADKISGVSRVLVTFTSATGAATVEAALEPCTTGPEGCLTWSASVPPGLLGLGPDGTVTAWTGIVTAEATDVAGLRRATTTELLTLG
jgi:outer membrane protein assembly factor BamB